ncbi:MAG: glycoside hydrolase family 1 protein [bacterium]|nr:glycoside hydrolase family 1 protein [bacterium]
MSIYKFPEGFKWGSATSAHQVEGDNHNDWSEWEKSPARLEQLKKEGKDPEDFISGNACDSYNRYEEDFDIAKKLNQNIHRFSIEWSRIEPEEGKFNEKEIRHYIDIVKALRERGIEPMITLWHFTNPIWFAEKGGWLNPESPELFLRFIKVIVLALKDQMGLWITFNEATTAYSGFVYLKGLWPPQYKNIFKWRRVNQNIIRAHTEAYKEIKKIYNNSPTGHLSKPDQLNEIQNQNWQKGYTSHNVMVGVVESNVFVPDTRNIFTTWLRRKYKRLRNFYFFNKATPYYDFIGLNYYHMDRRPKFKKKNEIVLKQNINKDMGWELYSQGIYNCLLDLKKYNKPIFVTENGIADATDNKRAKFIKDHLYWVYKAIQDGADVHGYMYWSLLDNFEWHHGYFPRFGLVEVDYKTFERRIRPSALEYAKICLTNQLEVD